MKIFDYVEKHPRSFAATSFGLAAAVAFLPDGPRVFQAISVGLFVYAGSFAAMGLVEDKKISPDRPEVSDINQSKPSNKIPN